MRKQIMAAIMAVSLATGSIQVNAASPKKDMHKILKYITTYTTALKTGNLIKNYKFKLNDKEMVFAAVITRFQYKHDSSYTNKELYNETKNLFGKKPKLSRIGPWRKFTFVKKTKNPKEPWTYYGGEFGDGIPLYKVKKIEKKGKLYKVTVRNLLGNPFDNDKMKVGTTIVTLKKSKASKYNYIIKKLEFKK